MYMHIARTFLSLVVLLNPKIQSKSSNAVISFLPGWLAAEAGFIVSIDPLHKEGLTVA
jgi:hypothetical protein